MQRKMTWYSWYGYNLCLTYQIKSIYLFYYFGYKSNLRAPDDVEILKRMEVDQHKDIVLKCFAGIRETLIVKSKDEFSAFNVVKDRLKGLIS